MSRICSLLLLFFFFTAYGQRLNDYVNPFIGTGGHGHTYPGAAAPFGMMQLSPDSRLDGWDGCGGYHYSDSIIYGFSHTHLSGTGVSDYGDLLIMPFTGKPYWNNGYNSDEKGYGSEFSHDHEKAAAGYYSVFLNEDEIAVGLTTSTRCGIHRYTYPKWEKKKVIIDLEHRDKLMESDLILINDSTLIGRRISKAWATEQHFYFTIQFSEASVKTEFRKNSDGKPSKLVLEFGHVNPELLVKVGMSAVDIDGAKKNLKEEMPHWEFEDYKAQNIERWSNELSKIDIHTSNQAYKTVFYTALYHSFLNPNTFSDVDGRYRGMDQEIHQSKNRNQYTIFSLWDTFRATHPLFTITQQKRTNEFVQTFLSQYKQGGILPIWELSGNYTGCMIGYHSIPVIVDAYNKGLRDFDADMALKAMLHSAEQNHLGLESYKKRGYISSEDESESVSKTLEYAYDDWCIAVFADSLGYDSIAAIYYQRGQYYKNIFNAKSGFMQPRHNGGWKHNFIPDEVTFDYTEANSWQYSLFAPQDVNGLMELLGGKDSLEVWLDNLFSVSSETSGRHQVDITGLIGQYAHGNEPSHHMAYLYNFTNAEWKTQKYVHQILTTLYSDQPDGLSGNEDCGQMSSWYVLSSMGIYSFSPGSDIYLTGTPIFDSVQINLENGNHFKIKAENLSDENIYVQSISLNGNELNRNYIYHHEIMNGGNLTFKMNANQADFKGESPMLAIEKSELLPSPVFDDASVTFNKKRKVVISSNTREEVTIRYTLDGTNPNEKSPIYKKPVKLKSSATVTARSFNGKASSYPVRSEFIRADGNWKIALNSEYANQYNAGGDRALIDKVRGANDFKTGAWQGYYGTDIDAVIDFKKKKKINEISVGFLQDIKSWIWLPSEVRFMISDDGENWFTVHTEKNNQPIDQYGSFLAEFSIKKAIKTRYIRILAKNRGVCPEWHLGAGNPTWLFADEINVK